MNTASAQWLSDHTGVRIRLAARRLQRGLRILIRTAAIGGLLVFWITPASAQDLYQGEVAVADQSQASRDEALRRALHQVLVKLSGERDLSAYRINEAVADAPRLAQYFQYRTVRTEDATGAPWEQQRLVARFSPAAAGRLLQDYRLPRWRQERTPLRLAVVIEDFSTPGRAGEAEPFLVDERQPWWRFLLLDVATARGMPVSVLAVEDEAQAIPLIIAGDTGTWVSEDNESGLLLGHARRAGQTWQVSWWLETDTLGERFRNSENRLDDALRLGLHQAIDRIAREATIAPAMQGRWQHPLVVEGVSDGRAYGRVLRYFQDLPVVDDVLVEGLEGTRLRLQLQLNATPSLLADEMERSGAPLDVDVDGRVQYRP